ncbi:MAG: hypothetical protein JO331_12220 [Verrucomicrobia bacterium]|nr:hypothetical protein [Verrucomicrobiota bacterium]MBV8969806.1 hypothetical protein [Verrucomicrobiota bacterium]
MSQYLAQKRKRRLGQLREAQRRRRLRLKEERKAFLQVILTQDMQHTLRELSASRDLPVHVCAEKLIEEGLARYRSFSPSPEPVRRGLGDVELAVQPLTV